MNRKTGFLMTYMHVDLNGPHMYIIRPTSSARSQRPECKGLVELAARHLKCTPLDQIAMPESLIDDVQKHVNRLPPGNKRIRYWAEEYCIATDCWDIYETTIEVPNEDSWRRLTAPRSDEKLRLKLIKHLSDCSKEQVLIFCKPKQPIETANGIRKMEKSVSQCYQSHIGCVFLTWVVPLPQKTLSSTYDLTKAQIIEEDLEEDRPFSPDETGLR
ncbi:hypothetical protein DPMN_141632 [Dreissena polymorpha]|uniref:Uncharacterized protein n=1 Tax=Dreissena polymorpha TaxID=45954 RepID=A0A9D4GDV8_DREPO|nr:hypothetical protein DPMN_141632 [Dreissena polymorpha]